MKIIYTALFVKNREELLSKFKPKHTKVFAHHATIEWKPCDLLGIEVGREVKLKVLGRVVDDKGEALIVERDKIKKPFPHITLSCVEGVMPAYCEEMIERATTNNTVEIFDKPIEIAVIEGYFDGVDKY